MKTSSVDIKSQPKITPSREQIIAILGLAIAMYLSHITWAWSSQNTTIDHPQAELFSRIITLSGATTPLLIIGLFWIASRITQSRLWFISAAALALYHIVNAILTWGVWYHAVSLIEVHLYLPLCVAIWRAPLGATLRRVALILTTLQVSKISLMYLDIHLELGLGEFLYYLNAFGAQLFTLTLLMLSGSLVALEVHPHHPRPLQRPLATLGAALLTWTLLPSPSLHGDLVDISQIVLAPLGALAMTLSWVRLPRSGARSFTLMGALSVWVTTALIFAELPFKNWLWLLGFSCLCVGAALEWRRSSSVLNLIIALGYLILMVLSAVQWEHLKDSGHLFVQALNPAATLIGSMIAGLYLVLSMIPEPEAVTASEKPNADADSKDEESIAGVNLPLETLAHHPWWDRALSISTPSSALMIGIALFVTYGDRSAKIALRDALRAESVEAQTRHAALFKSLREETGIEWIYISGASVTPKLRESWRSKVSSGSPHTDNAESAPETIEPFLLSRSEITVAQYRRCVEAQVCAQPSGKHLQAPCSWATQLDDYPMNCLSASSAQEYARWVGGALPTQVEWLYVARNRQLDDPTPWATDEVSCRYAVISSQHDKIYGCGALSSGAVCSHPEGHSIDGVCDLIGSLSEWVTYPLTLAGPRSERHIGGGWRSGISEIYGELRRGLAASPSESVDDHNRPDNIGFRVRRAAPASSLQRERQE